MSTTLIALAAISTTNPFRVGACAPPPGATRRQAVALAVAVTVGAVAVLTALSSPILDLLDVSGSSSRIAAGVAVLVVGVRDLFSQPPTPAPALKGWLAGIIPLAFPAIFSPALVILAISAAAERGAGTAVGIIGGAILVIGLSVAIGVRATYWRAAAVGSGGVILGTLLTLNGVSAI